MPDESYGPSAVTSRGQQGELWQLPDGRWRARYRQAGRDGKRPQQTFAENEKRKAARWLRDGLEKAEQRRGGRDRSRSLTVPRMIDDYLEAHEADPVTLAKLRTQLAQAKRAFPELLAVELEPYRAQAWRKTLSPGSRHDVFRALSQVYRQTVAWGRLDVNPCAEVKNPKPKRKEVSIPEWEWVEAIDDEIDERFEGVATFLAASGVRLEEFLALERRDVDLDERMIRVRRIYSSGRVVELGADGSKSWRQRRNVPLRKVALEALQKRPKRIDTPLLFPAPEGGYLRSENLRTRFWEPAIVAAGVPYFPAKNLRHLYASEALASGAMSLLALSRRLGTSVTEIDATYGHLVHDADERELAVLDAYDEARGKRAEEANQS